MDSQAALGRDFDAVEEMTQAAEAVRGPTARTRNRRRIAINPTHGLGLSDPDAVEMEPGENEGDPMVISRGADGNSIPRTLAHIPVHHLGGFGQRHPPPPPPPGSDPDPVPANDNFTCTKCGAKHWEGERTGGIGDGSFSICCQKGQVKLTPLLTRDELPAQLRELMADGAFTRCLREYNNMFAMVSSTIQNAMLSGMSEVRLNGAVHHRVGPIRPNPGYQRAYAQMYSIDPDDEITAVQRRMNQQRRAGSAAAGGRGGTSNRRRGGSGNNIRAHIVGSLQDMMMQRNPYARSFLHAHQNLRAHEELEATRAREEGRPAQPIRDIQVNIVNSGEPEIRRYNRPTGNQEMAAFMPEVGWVRVYSILTVYVVVRAAGWGASDLTDDADSTIRIVSSAGLAIYDNFFLPTHTLSTLTIRAIHATLVGRCTSSAMGATSVRYRMSTRYIKCSDSLSSFQLEGRSAGIQTSPAAVIFLLPPLLWFLPKRRPSMLMPGWVPDMLTQHLHGLLLGKGSHPSPSTTMVQCRWILIPWRADCRDGCG